MAAPERERHRSCCHIQIHSLLLAAAVVLLAGQAPGALAQSKDITDSFSDYNVVPAGRALYYDFVTFNYTDKSVPDVLVTLKSSDAVDVSPFLYCNPSWQSALEGNSVPGPQNAIFRSEESVLANTIFISANNPVIRPENARKEDSPEWEAYVPGYNCSVVSNDPTQGTEFTIDVAYNYRNIKLVEEEQDALRGIWDACCSREVNSSLTRVVDSGNVAGVDQAADAYNCGRWAQNNDLYGGNASEPFLDFCQIAGSACSNDGRLYKLDMGSYGLVCPFPKQFSTFSKLESLDLADNFDLTGKMSEVFEVLAEMKFLQILDLSDVSGLQGPLVPATGPEGKAALCRMVQAGLLVLNMAEIGLPETELPSCLFDAKSRLQELRIEFNDMKGPIPDVFTPGSQLRVLSALSTGLQGTIPASLGVCRDLEILDLGYNYLQGTIPANLGNSPYLRFLYLMNNNLTGSIPSSLALHEALEAIDVTNNRLSALPAEWRVTDAQALTARVSGSPLRNVQLGHNLFSGEFPAVFALLPDLVLFQAHDNRFTGQLPNQPGMFSRLRVFNVSANLLTGSIPDAFGGAGIFKLAQTNALGIKQLESVTQASEGAALRAQPQQFDVSRNQLSGNVPAFLFANSVPAFVRPQIDIRYNQLTVRCGANDKPPGQLQYLADDGHLCPQEPSPAALANLAIDNPTDNNLAGKSGPESTDSSGGGLPAFGKALISLAAIAAAAAAAAFVVVAYRRARDRGEPFTLGALAPSSFQRRGFKQFNDLEMTSGMDPLGFGPPVKINSQLNGHAANGTANGLSGGAKLKKSHKGGF